MQDKTFLVIINIDKMRLVAPDGEFSGGAWARLEVTAGDRDQAADQAIEELFRDSQFCEVLRRGRNHIGDLCLLIDSVEETSPSDKSNDVAIVYYEITE